MPTPQADAKPNILRSHRPNGLATDMGCPYCGQPISRKEFREIRARIETEERARIAEVEETLTARFARDKSALELQVKAAIDKAKKDTAKAAEAKLKAIRDSQEVTIAARLQAQRESLVKQAAAAVNVEKVKAFEEKTRLTEQLAEMQRRLERKPAHELGDPAEIDLFDQIFAAFGEDQVSRVGKGVKGPDIIVEVVHKGAVVGSIVIDCKNHKRWSNSFTVKLRSDQLALGADFAILSTAVFPASARQLHIQDNVIVADPARVVVLAHLLRRQIVDNFMLKLGAEARNEKADKLYDFILSPKCDDLFDRLLKLTRDAQALDKNEAKSHVAVWEKRAELFVGIMAVREQFVSVVADIIGGGQ
jgi:hypothetical protein